MANCMKTKRFPEGFETVCGVDEAGRGPACRTCVRRTMILPKGLVIGRLNDSKS